MSILDKIAEDEKTLAELQKGEEDGSIEETVSEEDTADEGSDDTGSGTEKEEITTEEVSDEPTEETVEEYPIGNRSYARLRREKAEAVKRAKEYEERLKALEERVSKPQEVEQKDAEPDVKKDPVAWLEWNDRQNKSEIAQLKESIQKEQKAKQEAEIIEQAKLEFTTYESQFAPTVKDYEDVAQFMFRRVAESLAVVNPSLSQQDLVDATQRHILQLAANYHAQGLNPAEELYFDAKDKFGYKAKEEAPKEVKRDLTKVANNRRRNAGMASVTGGSQPQVTKEMAAKMSIAEFAQLSQEDLKAIGM